MIPDEVVEAAARAWVGEQVWQDCDAAWRADYLGRARTMLQAAAPHLMAPILALADKWQEDFPDKARQLREAAGDAK